MPDMYRSCASIVVFRPSDVCSPDGCGTVYEILLLHKPRKNDSWQLPQGGVEEGESVEQAALRELHEEAGLNATMVGHTKQFYEYDFPASYRSFRPDSVCGQKIEFVFAIVDKNAVVKVDNKEIDAYVWVLPEQVSHYLKRKEYLKTVHALLKEGTALLSAS